MDLNLGEVFEQENHIVGEYLFFAEGLRFVQSNILAQIDDFLEQEGCI